MVCKNTCLCVLVSKRHICKLNCMNYLANISEMWEILRIWTQLRPYCEVFRSTCFVRFYAFPLICQPLSRRLWSCGPLQACNGPDLPAITNPSRCKYFRRIGGDYKLSVWKSTGSFGLNAAIITNRL